jgi:hypothetical protein
MSLTMARPVTFFGWAIMSPRERSTSSRWTVTEMGGRASVIF